MGPIIRPTAGRLGSWRTLLGVLFCATVASTAAAADQIYFPAVDNVANILVQKINAETVRVDLSCWYLTEHAISIALINKYKSGVPVRLLGDRGSIFEIDPRTKNEFYWLASQGLPIRLRFNPIWYPEIDHWKASIFVGQNTVSFGSANYTPFELAPASSVDYKDETVLFTDDPVIVNALKTKFDRFWNDTTPEPESIAGNPPYFKNWNDACTAEPTGNCSDYRTLYPNPTPMVIDTRRLEPDNFTDVPDIVWGQGPKFNDRLVQEIDNESSLIQFVIYRLTVDNITQALLNRFHAGVPVRLIIEPNEYLNRKWPEFWISHANFDKLYAAGVPMKQRKHSGLTHMKTLVTSTVASNASSNYAAAWQRDIDYFVPAATKPTIYNALKNRVTFMWNDTVGYEPFKPLPPDDPTLASPASGTTAVATTSSLVWNITVFAVSYDVYLGTSQSNMTLVGNVPAQLVNSPPSTYSWTPSTPLQTGTTYFWRVIARTNATPVNPSLVGTSPIWSFTTAGTAANPPPPPPPPPPPSGTLPSPWTTQDVGSTGIAGSASASNGTFTVSGSGADIWGTSDAFRYVFQPMNGSVQVVARVTSLQNTHAWAKAGVMMRESLSATAAHVILDVTPSGTIEFMTRSSTGAATTLITYGSQAPPAWLKLSRSGTIVSASVSANGSTWTALGTTTFAPASANIGLIVTSHDTTTLNTATFDNISVGTVSSPPPPPPPPSSSGNIVIYASDIAAAARHGSWTIASDPASPNGTKLVTPDNGVANTSSALAAPADYVDVTFNASAGTPYTLWLRLQALGSSKLNDSLWVQFSDASTNGAPVYPLNSASALLVNLATDSTAGSLSGWGWQNTAYWLQQPVTVTFSTAGSHTMRIQVREDGVQLDQIVLSPSQYLTTAPGTVSNDRTIVPKQ